MKKTSKQRTSDESKRNRNLVRQTRDSNEVILNRPAPVSPVLNLSQQYSVLQRLFGPFLITAETLFALLVLFFEIRVFLLMVFADLTELSIGQVGQLFYVGFQFDLLVGLIVLMPQITLIAAHNNFTMEYQGSKLALLSGLFGTLLGVSFICLADVLCFVECKARLNMGELITSGQIDATLMGVWQDYPVVPLALFTGAIATAVFLVMRRRAHERLGLPFSLLRRTTAFIVAVAMIVALGRTTGVEHMHVTNDEIANQCSGNGIYTFCHDLWNHCNYSADGTIQTTIAPKTEVRVW